MMPRGFGHTEVLGCASSPGQNSELELTVMAEDAGSLMTISRARLLFTGNRYHRLSVPFYCPRDLPVSLEIRSLGGGASLDQIRLRAALSDNEVQAVPLVHPGVVVDAPDNLQTSRNTGYGWGDLEDWKQPSAVGSGKLNGQDLSRRPDSSKRTPS